MLIAQNIGNGHQFVKSYLLLQDLISSVLTKVLIYFTDIRVIILRFSQTFSQVNAILFSPFSISANCHLQGKPKWPCQAESLPSAHIHVVHL